MSNRPIEDIYVINKNGKSGEDQWCKIGARWEGKKSSLIILDALPFDRKLLGIPRKEGGLSDAERAELQADLAAVARNMKG